MRLCVCPCICVRVCVHVCVSESLHTRVGLRGVPLVSQVTDLNSAEKFLSGFTPTNIRFKHQATNVLQMFEKQDP